MFFFRVYIFSDLWILLCEWKPEPSYSISASRLPRLIALIVSIVKFLTTLCFIFFINNLDFQVVYSFSKELVIHQFK